MGCAPVLDVHVYIKKSILFIELCSFIWFTKWPRYEDLRCQNPKSKVALSTNGHCAVSNTAKGKKSIKHINAIEKKNATATLFLFCFGFFWFSPFGLDIVVISCLILTNEMSTERAKSNKQTVHFRFLYNCKNYQ